MTTAADFLSRYRIAAAALAVSAAVHAAVMVGVPQRVEGIGADEAPAYTASLDPRQPRQSAGAPRRRPRPSEARGEAARAHGRAELHCPRPRSTATTSRGWRRCRPSIRWIAPPGEGDARGGGEARRRRARATRHAHSRARAAEISRRGPSRDRLDRLPAHLVLRRRPRGLQLAPRRRQLHHHERGRGDRLLHALPRGPHPAGEPRHRDPRGPAPRALRRAQARNRDRRPRVRLGGAQGHLRPQQREEDRGAHRQHGRLALDDLPDGAHAAHGRDATSCACTRSASSTSST